MRTSSIIVSTRILVWKLSERMVDVDVIGSVRSVSEDLKMFSCELVCPQQCLDIPVSPVEPVIDDGEGKYMRNLWSTQDLVSVLAIKVRIFNVVQVSISPEYFVTEIIDCQGIWPDQFVLIQDNSSKV